MAETDDDWRELFETYRYEVIRAGFGAWDEAAFADEDPDERADELGDLYRPELSGLAPDGQEDVSERFERYARRFVKMLNCLEAGTVERLVDQLGDRVRTRDGGPVTTVVVRSGDREIERLGDRYRYEGLVATFLALNEILFSSDEPEPQGTLVAV